MQVSNITEIPADYAKALDAADTLEKLQTTVRLYAEVAYDAMSVSETMTTAEFDEWRKALKKERRGRFMGENAVQKFGDLLMPSIMFKISMVADQYKVPWGLAYNRLAEVGKLTVKNGVAVLSL